MSDRAPRQTPRVLAIGIVAENNGAVRDSVAVQRPRTFDALWQLVTTMGRTLDLQQRAQQLQREELDFLTAKHEALLADVVVLREQVRLGR